MREGVSQHLKISGVTNTCVRTEGQKGVLEAHKEFTSKTHVCPDVTEKRDYGSMAGPGEAGRAWPPSPRQRRKQPQRPLPRRKLVLARLGRPGAARPRRSGPFSNRP